MPCASSPRTSPCRRRSNGEAAKSRRRSSRSPWRAASGSGEPASSATARRTRPSTEAPRRPSMPTRANTIPSGGTNSGGPTFPGDRSGRISRRKVSTSGPSASETGCASGRPCWRWHNRGCPVTSSGSGSGGRTWCGGSSRAAVRDFTSRSTKRAMWPPETRSNFSGRTTGSQQCRRSSTKSEGKNRADSLRDRDRCYFALLVLLDASLTWKVKEFITVLMIERASWSSGEGGPMVGNETANLDVSRVVTLVGTSIAIFTFLLFFLQPRFASGDIDPVLFQVTLIVIGVAIFSLVYAGLFFYTLTLPYSLNPVESGAIQRRGDLFWLVGYSVLLLEPTLILLTVRLLVVALVWLALWLSYIYLTLHEYRKALNQKVR